MQLESSLGGGGLKGSHLEKFCKLCQHYLIEKKFGVSNCMFYLMIHTTKFDSGTFYFSRYDVIKLPPLVKKEPIELGYLARKNGFNFMKLLQFSFIVNIFRRLDEK